MPWLAAGCVVPEPEKFREPERSPPILDLDRAAPPVNQLVEVRTDGTGPDRDFTIPVRSEDRGERLSGVVFLNYRTRSQSNAGYLILPASTIDDTSREFQFRPDLRSLRCEQSSDVDPGCCHVLTLVVTHEQNIITEGGQVQPDPELSKGDQALAVWWLAVDAPAVQPSLIDECPRPGANP